MTLGNWVRWLGMAAMLGAMACGDGMGTVDDPDDTSDEEGGAALQSLPVGTKLETTGNLNMRSGPSTSHSVLTVLPVGTVVTLLESAPSGNFYRVKAGEKAGYASGKFLRVVSKPDEAQGDGGSGGSGAGGNGAGGNSPGGTTGSPGMPSSCDSVSLQSTLTFQLDKGAFPGQGHPDVAVHVPQGFRPCDRPGAVVFFHGWDNCVANAIGSVNSTCTPGGAKRIALGLSDQFDAAQVNAMLIAVEIAFDQSSGNPGALTKTNRLRDMLHELFVEHLDPMLGVPLDVPDLERVVIGSHSGGYLATANVLDHGGVPQITEVDPLRLDVRQRVVFPELGERQPVALRRVEAQRRALRQHLHDRRRHAEHVAGHGRLVRRAPERQGARRLDGRPALVGLVTDADLAHPVVFVHSSRSHYGVPQEDFEAVTRRAGFTPL